MKIYSVQHLAGDGTDTYHNKSYRPDAQSKSAPVCGNDIGHNGWPAKNKSNAGESEIAWNITMKARFLLEPHSTKDSRNMRLWWLIGLSMLSRIE